jgi:vancomycin resistance protein VanJ
MTVMHGNESAMRRRRRISISSCVASAVLLALCTLCYAIQADALATLTLMPAWLWVIPGIALMAPAIWLNRRLALGGGVAWLWFLILFTDQPLSILHREPAAVSGEPLRASEAAQLRIVTLNCDGSAAAAAELIPLSADVVLLQEAPRRDLDLIRRICGSDADTTWGSDTAIIARTKLDPIRLSSTASFFAVASRMEHGGRKIVVVCVRLAPDPGRVDILDPASWSERRDLRRLRRSQLQALFVELHAASSGCDVVIGGDFNAPVADPIFSVIPQDFEDAFSRSGRGWGNTILNDLPLHRIDRIFTRGWQAIDTIAARTLNSDHRLVRADFRR